MTRQNRTVIINRPYFLKAMVFAILLISGSLLLPSAAWSEAASDNQPAAGELATAPVVVDGKELFKVVGISLIPPEDRAKKIAGLIRAAASDRSVDDEDIIIIRAENGFLEIREGDRTIMRVLKEDAAIEGIEQDLMAGVIRYKILESIKNYRFERTSERILKQSLFAAGAFLIAVAVFFVLKWLFRKLSALVERRIRKMLDAVENKTFNLVRSAQIWRVINTLFSLIRTVAIVVVLVAFAVYGLGLFPWTRNVSRVVLDIVLTPLRALVRGVFDIIPNLVVLAFIIFFTRYVLKLLKLFFAGIKEGNFRLTTLEPELALPTYNIVRILLLLFSIVIAYPYIPGSQSPAFKALSVFVGVLFSLGSSSLIGNIIAGYSMTFRKAFRPGDRIMVDGQVGYVEEQKTMTTRIRTVKNEEIVMPNSVLINSSIINYSTKARQDGVILHSSVRVGYETPWRLVDAMLLTAADRTRDIQKDRPPFVLKKALDDAAIEYEINVYCVDPMKINSIYSELHGHILDIFNENAVQIMRPSYEGDPDSPKVVPKEEWHRPLRVDDPDAALKEDGYRKNMEDAVRSGGDAGKE